MHTAHAYTQTAQRASLDVFPRREPVQPLQSLGILHWSLLGLMDERHSLLAVIVSLRLLLLLSCFTGLCAVAGHLVINII